MEELQVIETTSGRQFKPWASKEDVQAIKQETVQAVLQAVQDPASITAITSEIASGKQAIASAINTKGGSASATESFSELAEAVEEIPNFSDMVKLAGIIAGGNYTKNALQGHNENVKYGKTEIIDNVGAFETINVPYCFQYWDLLEKVKMSNLTTVSNGYTFYACSSLKIVDWPNLTVVSGGSIFRDCTSLQNVFMPSLVTFDSTYFLSSANNLTELIVGTLTTFTNPFYSAKPKLRNVTIGQDTNINLDLHDWTATDVIAEGQSGIDELNSNLQTNLIAKLYQGGGKILRLGVALYNVTTQETRDMVTSKGWTLQRG